MTDFAAIDFETANARRSSICSVGVVIVRGGVIVEKIYRLVRPTPNYYNYWTTEIHGLTRRDTEAHPHFPQVWAEIHESIKGLPLVAHNKAFDEGCLRAAFSEFGMEYPEYKFLCTLAASRRAMRLPSYCLDVVSEACGFELANHHHALADAEAVVWCVLGMERLTGRPFEEL